MEYLLIVVIIFFAGLVNSTFGFGFAMVSMPILSLFFEPKLILPLIPMLFISSNLIIVLRSWREIQIRSVLPMLIAALIIIPVGVQIGTQGDGKMVKILLGSFLLAFSIFNLISPQLPELKTEKPAPLFGLISGFFGGAFNISGPPIVIYGLLRRWNPQVFRATLQGYFTILTSMIIFNHYRLGSYEEPKVFTFFIIALPASIIAAPIGKRINQKFENPEEFQRYIYYLMLILGFLLILKGFKLL